MFARCSGVASLCESSWNIYPRTRSRINKITDAMRKLQEKFGASRTGRATNCADGVTRPMTDEERQFFDKAFISFDATFSDRNKMFDEVQKEKADG